MVEDEKRYIFTYMIQKKNYYWDINFVYFEYQKKIKNFDSIEEILNFIRECNNKFDDMIPVFPHWYPNNEYNDYTEFTCIEYRCLPISLIINEEKKPKQTIEGRFKIITYLNKQHNKLRKKLMKK